MCPCYSQETGWASLRLDPLSQPGSIDGTVTVIHSHVNAIEHSVKEPEDEGVCCETECPGNIRSYTHTGSPAWPPERKLNKEDTGEHA